MPTRYAILPEKRLAWCYAEGHYSFEEILSRLVGALTDPRSNVGVHLVIDVRRSEESRTSDEMRVVAKSIRKCKNFSGRCAMLVDPASTLRYGLARMLSIHAELEGKVFEVFNDEAKALAWLEDSE